MRENPYEAPETPIRPPVGRVDVQKARSLLRPPAIALILLASLAILMDLVLIVGVIVQDAPRLMREEGPERARNAVLLNTFANGGLCFIHAVVCFGSVQMARVRSYSLAVMASILSLIPFCAPIVIFGIPFAIWALVILCRDGVKEAFQTNAHLATMNDAGIKFLD